MCFTRKQINKIHVKYIRIMYISTQNGCSLATFLIETESQNTWANSKQNMAVMASDGPSPHSPSLCLGLPAPQPSRHHHAQSLLGPSFHDPRMHHVLESHPEQAVPLSRRNDEWRHAVGSRSALVLRLYLAACNPSSSCRFWVLDHLCSNLSQSFHFCWITEIWSLNLCVCFSSAFDFLEWTSASSPCLQFGRYHHSNSAITFTLV